LAEGIAATSALFTPDSIALDAAGNLYIGDHNHEDIRKASAATGLINTIVGNGAYGDAGDGGQAINATITSPQKHRRQRGRQRLLRRQHRGAPHRRPKRGVITTVSGVPAGFSMNFDSAGTLYAIYVRGHQQGHRPELVSCRCASLIPQLRFDLRLSSPYHRP